MKNKNEIAKYYYDEGYDSSDHTNPYDGESFGGQQWQAGHEAAAAAEGRDE